MAYSRSELMNIRETTRVNEVSSMLSDHFVVQADLLMSRPREKAVSYRKYDQHGRFI